MIENSVNAGSIGVGNYKGVMLCNRPFGNSTAVNKQSNAPQKVTFTTGVVPESIGINVPIAAHPKLTKRPKKDSVLAKHKKWLIELQKKKDRLEEEYLDEMRRKEESQEKFQEHERQMRLASKKILRESKEAAAAAKEQTMDSKDDTKGAGDKHQPLAASAPDALQHNNNSFEDTENSIPTIAQAKTYGGASSSASAKPAWAMTEEAAASQFDEMLQDEENELIEFAKSLDFDKYIGDIEVQTMMERLRRRITELEKEVALDDLREADAASRAALRSKLEQMGKLEAGLREEGAEQSAESKAMAEARALLQEEEDMQAVHSAKSTAALLQQAKDKIETVRQGVQPPKEVDSSSPKIKNEPLIVTHEPNEGARLGDKNDISNLPYMHRNPAV